MSSEPYYQDGQVTLYHGDCLEIDAWLESDVLVTDPPYGIRWEQRGSARSPKHGHIGMTDAVSGDCSPQLRDSVLTLWNPKPAIVFGTWKVARPDCQKVLIWDKRGAFSGPLCAPFFTSHEEIYVCGEGFRASSPPQRSVLSTNELRSAAVAVGHPTPKPVGLMETLIDRCPPGVIADTFAGSGPTLLAARNLGRKAIGVEIEERYCEITAKRLEQMCLEFGS